MSKNYRIFCQSGDILVTRRRHLVLTERIIRDVKPNGKARTIWDSQVVGLGLQVTQGGKRNFILRYKIGGHKRQAILCRAAESSLQEIRKRAARELLRIRAGETDPLERQRDAREAPTLNDGLDRFFNEFVPVRIEIGRMTPRTVATYQDQARRYLRPALGKRKIVDITRHHVERMVEPLPKAQRNRVLALTSRLFTLFETWEWRPQHTNPARGIERAREEPRDRVLSPSELAALAAALNDAEPHHPAPVAAIRLAGVTGLRIGEILGIRWEHLEFETGRLTLPATKTGRRVHDLPSPAMAILTSIPRVNAWVFTSRDDVPVTYRWVRKVFLAVAGAAGLTDVRLHDLRRGYMTAAAAAGVGTYVLRDLLGHKTTAMADRYIRTVGNPVRDAREHVSATVAAMMTGGTGDVIPMRRRSG